MVAVDRGTSRVRAWRLDATGLARDGSRKRAA
jgi:hypothetical protein